MHSRVFLFLQLVGELRAVFRTGRTRTYEWRKAQLTALLKLLDDNEAKLCDALYKDLHKVGRWNYGEIVVPRCTHKELFVCKACTETDWVICINDRGECSLCTMNALR